MAQGSGIEWTEWTWNPVTGCYEDQPRLQVLLRRAHGGTATGDGPGELPERLPADTAATHARAAAALEEAADHLRELDERPVSSGHTARRTSSGFST